MINTDILFSGYYGMQNTGDDAFIEVASWGAKKYWQKDSCRFLALQRQLPKTIVPSKGYPLTFPKSYRFQQRLLLKSTNCLISAGGSTLHSEMKADNIKLLATEIKKTSNLKVGAIGISIGPFRSVNDEVAVKKYLKEIDFLAVRDHKSFEFAASLDLPYEPVNAFDLAALLPEIYQPLQKDNDPLGQKVVGISICPVESTQRGGDMKNEVRRNTQIVELIKSIDQSADVLFRFFIINGNPRNGDLALTHQIIAGSSPKNFQVIEYQKETKIMWEHIGSCDFVLATRLHAAIFACFAEVPFLLVEYHRKCTDFLNDVGFNSEAMIGDADYEIKPTTDLIVDWITYAENYPAPTLIGEMRKKAFLNFSEIKI